MTCVQKGTLLSPNDVVRSTWLFTAHSDQHCHPGMGPRNFSHPHRNSTLPPGVKMDRMGHNHWLILENVKPSDQGRYCCGILEFNKHSFVQKAYNHIILQVIPRKYVKRCECALRLYWICPEMPLINIFCKKLRSWCCWTVKLFWHEWEPIYLSLSSKERISELHCLGSHTNCKYCK